ncbi:MULTISPECIES: 2OG-Fe(II) oxygenase [unclassified Luteimonas]|uniref:2OG-Fe(II) oxygenase n=1 Tax=unclassified Luteimonas TaxID=2629088 RepID=UPI001601FA36|nr:MULTISPECIES: 2OG-Fe(II) oxygenase [unclassified Luteimonas]MBB1472421.1 2OG-Fe(II) oxygenase [Luteimonas sp. MC1782]MBB6598867.1 2OG-Fe(II) oxygenase [Luteimonas sp. MC1825]QOC89018.1 2OG-Fe(II) oxygenase [Luteimonas sp. MC1825]
MDTPVVDAALVQWLLDRVRSGASPDEVLGDMVGRGWDGDAAAVAIEDAMRRHLDAHALDHGLPLPQKVPSPIVLNGPSLIDAGDREVAVLAHLLHPRVVVFGGVLSGDECDALVALGRERLAPSPVFDPETGADQAHPARTSEGMFFRRGENALCARIEQRLAALVDWPLEHGEGLQLLRYGPGAEYRPHYDYFDPATPGAHVALARGGQRVASIVMYLNTPARGGATTFPDARFEVAAVKGNAVFFAYDRPHPMTGTLHGGAPVVEGEKWVATKWLRIGHHA